LQPITLTHSNGKTEVLYDPTQKQQEFHACEEPNVLYVGSRGTGKSLALRWEAHARALTTPGFTYVILRRTYPELQKSHLLFIDQEAKKLGATYHRTDRIITYPNGSKGFFSHCSTDEDVLNLLSAQFAWMGIDELSTFPWEMVTSLKTSVRVTKTSGLKALFRAATNPFGVSAPDINRYFVLKDIEPEEDPDYNPNDWRSIHTVMSDNPYIDANEYRKQFAGLPFHQRKAWLDGEFSEERALFSLVPEKRHAEIDPDTGAHREVRRPYHVIEELPTFDGKSILEQPWVQVFRAYDHGFARDPAVCLWFAVIGKRIICFKERTWLQVHCDQIARDILNDSRGMHVTATYCDPSIHVNDGSILSIKDSMEQQWITQRDPDGRERRVHLTMDPSINNREQFADAIHRALLEEVEPGVPRIQFLRGNPSNPRASGCPYLIKSLPQMRYDERNPLRLADHKHDHAPVALAYFLMSYIPTTQAPARSGTPWWVKEYLPSRHRTFRLGSESVRRRAA
jgi:hypothetical protein